MTTGKRLEHARDELLAFESEHPRSREDVVEATEGWLDTAQHVVGFDVAGAIGGSLHREHLAAVIDAFVVGSPQFREWLLAEAVTEGLLGRKERDRQLSKLRKAVSAAEAAIAREEIETRRAALERELAELSA